MSSDIKKLLIISAVALLIGSSQAQIISEDSLLSHYPLQVGNKWDYSGAEALLDLVYYPRWTLVTATRDSLHHNGKKYTVLETKTYDMRNRHGPGSLGGFHKGIVLQRVDSTSLNVYQIYANLQPTHGDEFLTDSLRAKEGDAFVTNFEYNNILQLYEVATRDFLGEVRTTRHVIVLNPIAAFDFTTGQGLGEISRVGGEGTQITRELQGALIQGDTVGTLLRNQPPGLALSKDELLFSSEIRKHRLFLKNDKAGMTIIDSVAVRHVQSLYSHPFYRSYLGYPDTTFSRGPFLIFPQDSIYLDIFIRERALQFEFEDTLRIYASGVNGEILPPITLPIQIDPIVSVRESPLGNQELPDTFQLRAYPNPLHTTSRLSLSYQLSGTEHVKIQIYDILGRTVATLVEQEMPRGKHQLTWDAHDLPSGPYFVSLRAAGLKETIRVQIVK